MKTFLNTHRSSRGSTYLTVVVTMIFVGIMLAAYLKMVGTQNTFAAHSQTWNRSVAVLEAGIEEAMGHLNKNGSPDSGGTFILANMSRDGWDNNGSLNGPWSKQGWIDGDSYYVVIGTWNGNPSSFPSISSTGFVRQLPAYARYGSGGPFLAALVLPDLQSGSFSQRSVRAGLTNIMTFSKGLVAKHGIDMNGQNTTVDSYDSGNPAYSTNGRYDASKHRDHGDIASNDTVTNSLSVGNANVWGHIATGPLGTVDLGPNGSVGDSAWVGGGSKGIKPGYSTDDMNVEFPDVKLPANCTAWLPPATTLVPGYQYVFATPGDYRINGIINDSILISAPNVRLYVGGSSAGWNYTGSDALTITSNASVKIYLDCPSASIAGLGIVNESGVPNQCYIFGTEKLTSFDIGGNGANSAVLYAPYANVTLHGGGAGAPDDFSGAMIANSFKFVGHFNIHYDEALGRTGLWRGFMITSWNEK